MREALSNLKRYIVTARVAKYRLFVWLDIEILPDCQLIAIARQDDYFFGVLHSKLHEVWSLRMGTWLGKGNDPRYTPTTTFETFPFPFVPGQEPTDDPRYQAIAAAAKQLEAERSAWLNPTNPTPSPSPNKAEGRTGFIQGKRWSGKKVKLKKRAWRRAKLAKKYKPSLNRLQWRRRVPSGLRTREEAKSSWTA